MKGVNFKPLKICETGQVGECLGQVAHEVYLADGQVEIVTFSGPAKHFFLHFSFSLECRIFKWTLVHQMLTYFMQSDIFKLEAVTNLFLLIDPKEEISFRSFSCFISSSLSSCRDKAEDFPYLRHSKVMLLTQYIRGISHLHPLQKRYLGDKVKLQNTLPLICILLNENWIPIHIYKYITKWKTRQSVMAGYYAHISAS